MTTSNPRREDGVAQFNQDATERDCAVPLSSEQRQRCLIRLKKAEGNSDNGEDAGGAGDLEGAGSAGVAALAAAAATGVALRSTLGLVRAVALRVLLLATAGELALDGTAVLEVLEGRADIVEVLLGLEVEGTTDVSELGEVGPMRLLVLHW